MKSQEIKALLDDALLELAGRDAYLLENDLSERCIAARLALYLQSRFPDYAVDVEFNKAGQDPKKLGLPPECANRRDELGRAYVLPDIIIHHRGADGPNLLALELKKTTNRDKGECDRMRLRAFREQLHYQCAALIICETRERRKPEATIAEWLE